jgi:cadmium resistance protein CadD (predicted permease)
VLELLARLLPLMLAAAANPVVITLVVLVLTARDRPLARAGAFFAGFALVLIVGGILGLTVFHNSKETFGPGGDLYAWIDLGFGALMLGAAALAYVRRGAGDDASRMIERLGPLACAGLGAVMMATNTSAIAAYVPLLHEISNSGLDRADRLIALAISDLVILAPIGAPILIKILAPRQADRALGAIRRFLDRYGSQIAAIVFAALGVFLVLRGIHRL